MQINSTSNVNFEAKLDISRVKGSKQRWQNIARMFEEKTKRYPNDTLNLMGSFNKGCYLNHWFWGEAEVSSAAMAKLKKLSDKEIVKNIVDVFNLFKKEGAYINKTNDFAKQLKLDKLDRAHNTNFEERLTNWSVDIMRAEEKEFIKKHPVFHNDGIIF